MCVGVLCRWSWDWDDPRRTVLVMVWKYLADREQREDSLEEQPKEHDAKNLPVPERVKWGKHVRKAEETRILLATENKQCQNHHRKQQQQTQHT